MKSLFKKKNKWSERSEVIIEKREKIEEKEIRKMCCEYKTETKN